MKAARFLTALTIASALSVALAQPLPVPPETYDRSYERPYDHYDRDTHNRDRYASWDSSRYARDFREGWIPLARRTETLSGRQFINLDGRSKRLDLLRIEADRGTPVIKRIAVEYANGTREIMRVDASLSRGAGQVIDLQGDRHVSRIVVIADPRYYGMYSIYGT